MYIFGIRARTGRTLPPNFAAEIPPCFRRIFRHVSAAFSARARPRPPRLFPHTELFVPLRRNLTSRSVPRSFSRVPGRK